MSAEGGPKDTVKKKEVNTKEKEDVLCKYCDKVMRKDRVGKHFENNHKDRKAKGEKACFKHIAAGTPGLGKFIFFTSVFKDCLLADNSPAWEKAVNVTKLATAR